MNNALIKSFELLKAVIKDQSGSFCLWETLKTLEISLRKVIVLLSQEENEKALKELNKIFNKNMPYPYEDYLYLANEIKELIK